MCLVLQFMKCLVKLKKDKTLNFSSFCWISIFGTFALVVVKDFAINRRRWEGELYEF